MMNAIKTFWNDVKENSILTAIFIGVAVYALCTIISLVVTIAAFIAVSLGIAGATAILAVAGECFGTLFILAMIVGLGFTVIMSV